MLTVIGVVLAMYIVPVNETPWEAQSGDAPVVTGIMRAPETPAEASSGDGYKGCLFCVEALGYGWCERGALSGLSWCASAAGECTGGGECLEWPTYVTAIAADGVIHLTSLKSDGADLERDCRGRVIARNYDETTVAEIRSRTKAVTI